MLGFKQLSILLIVVTVGIAGCRSIKISNIESRTYAASGAAYSSNLSLEDYEKAIIRAGSKRNWVFRHVTPGQLEGAVTIRGKHTAVVDVFFDTSEFSIIYKDSQNLNFDADKGAIHPNYNSWVKLLGADIQSEIQLLRSAQ